MNDSIGMNTTTPSAPSAVYTVEPGRTQRTDTRIVALTVLHVVLHSPAVRLCRARRPREAALRSREEEEGMRRAGVRQQDVRAVGWQRRVRNEDAVEVVVWLERVGGSSGDGSE